MVANLRPSLRLGRFRPQRGQAATELVFCLLFLAAFVAVLFQALHFELDVFNKTELLRYKALHRARQDQDTTDPETITDETVQGKNLSDLTTYTVPLQEIDTSQHWGPKRLVIRHGTKYWDPTQFHEDWEFLALLTPDHYETTSGAIGKIFDVLKDFMDNIPA